MGEITRSLAISGVGGFETAVAFLNEVVAYSFFGKKRRWRTPCSESTNNLKKCTKRVYFTYCLDWLHFNFHQCYGSAVWNTVVGTTSILKLALKRFWLKSGQNWQNGGHLKKKSLLKFKFETQKLKRNLRSQGYKLTKLHISRSYDHKIAVIS